jgi:hypothetical protein
MRSSLTLLFCLSILTSMAQWGPPTTIASSDLIWASGMMTGDLDGDGDLDVLASPLYAPEVHYLAYMNEGEWQFSGANSVTLPADLTDWLEFASVIDVNGDGLADLTEYSGSPIWYRNLGNLQFGDPQLIVASSAYQFCDLDGQYGLDLILVGPNGSPGYYYAHQLPGGGFTEPVQISDAALGPFDDPDELPFLLIDLNGDAIDDLLYKASGVAPLQVATGTALGGFDPPQAYYTVPTGLAIRRFTLIDRDPSNDNNGFKVDVTSPDQSIWFEPTIGLAYTTSVTELIVGDGIDLNGDGAQDLWISSGEYASIRLNDGSGTFLDAVPVGTANLHLKHEFADMDNDGDRDVTILQYYADRVAILENDGAGTLNTRHNVTSGDLPHLEKLDIVDLDSDGDLDLLGSNYGDLRVLLNDGSGTFGVPLIIDENYTKFDFTHIDIDQDGDLDVVSIGYWNTVKLHVQVAAGQFTTLVLNSFDSPVESISGPRLVRTIDVDLDGDLDIMVAQNENVAATPLVYLIENLGAMTFAEATELGALDGSLRFLMECLVVDMNNDGLLDRLGNIGGNLGVYLNIGSALDDPLLFNGTYGKPVMVSDLNGDGVLDIIADVGASLVLWHATAPFAYEAAQTVALPGEGLSYQTLKDVDNDGRVDLVLANGQQLLLHRCGSDGLFGQPSLVWDFQSSGEPLSMAYWGFAKAGDLTGDGLVDLLVATNQGQGELLTNLSNSNYQISGRIFHDLNGDQVYQPEEPPLPWVNLQVTPDASSPFTDVDGVYTVYATPGTYTLQPAVDPELWTVTSTTPLQATLTGGSPIATDMDFAVAPAQDISLIDASLTLGTGPCGDSTYLSISIINTGTRIEQGTIALQLHPSFFFVASSTIPESQVGNTITWTFDDLGVQEVRSIVAVVTTPPTTMAGELWFHSLQVNVLDDDGAVLTSANSTLEGTVRCAYDPNDKQVHPAGYGEAGAIDLDTPFLDYTVRFQNTGTAPAFDVVIMDQLDTDLDPERVEVLGFSHTPTQVAITANGSIQFKFLDIMLPDSATDQLGSQGFIHFRIHLREGLPHLTAIPNTAAIYFDLNPPIITNTVHSTLVDCNTWQPMLEANEYGVLRAPAGDLYQWFLNGDPIPGAVADSIQLTTNGSYTVEVTSTLGCVATTPAIIATDIPETHMELGLMLVPNPFTRHARLIATTPLGTGGQVSLLDLHGRVLWTRATPGGPSLDLDFEGLAPGPYLLRVEQAGAAPRVLRALLQ